MSDRKGFTFIELVVVVTVIGLLTAIVVPKLRRFKDRVYVAAMKSDLRTFAMHEESYYYDRATYTDEVAKLAAAGYRTSPEVSVTVNEATILGWSATATHTVIPVKCYVFIGDAAPVGTSTSEGTVACS
ncbi:MAG: type IV pilin protein [Gemmatimonadales bacterium]